MDLLALKNEIINDPLHLGYSNYYNMRDTVTLAGILNLQSSYGNAPIIASSKTKGKVLTLICPFLDQIAIGKDLSGVALSPNVMSKWIQRFNALQAGDPLIDFDPPFQGMLQQAVTDNIATQAQVNAVLQRPASRAENLFGVDTVIQPTDIFAACYNSNGSIK